MQRHPAIENALALTELRGIFHRFEQLKYQSAEKLCEEIKLAVRIKRNCQPSRTWGRMQSLPCGADDAYGERIQAAQLGACDTFDAVRLARGRMPARVLELLRQIREGN